MSRIDWSDDEERPGQFALWRANTARSICGREGQRALQELRAALLAMPHRRLIAHELVTPEGEVCAVGALVTLRADPDWQTASLIASERWHREDPDWWEPDTTMEAGMSVGIPRLVAWRLVELNDMDLDAVSPEERWERVFAWAGDHLSMTLAGAIAEAVG